MIFRAIEFAARAHKGQFRKNTRIPYITHPLAVARILLELDCEEELAVAAVLHDTVEDTPVSFSDIEGEFGSQVAEWVRGASEPSKKRSWEDRKEHTLASLPNATLDVVVLVCADKLHNLRSIRKDLSRQGESVWLRFTRPKEKQEWYFTSLLAVFKKRLSTGPGILLVEQFEKEVNRVFASDGRWQ